MGNRNPVKNKSAPAGVVQEDQNQHLKDSKNLEPQRGKKDTQDKDVFNCIH